METRRRNFIGTLTGLFLGSFLPKIVSGKSSEKVKMLTADGKMVEVDARVVSQAKNKKTTNQEIFNWSRQILDKRLP